MQERLRNFFQDFYLLTQGHKTHGVRLYINDCKMSDFFATHSFPPVIFDEGDDGDTIPETALKGRFFDDIFLRLGLPDNIPFKKHVNYRAEVVAVDGSIGWSLYFRDVKFGRHAVLEVGDVDHHVRIDIKNSWSGDPFNAQIDRVIVWDSLCCYDLPLGIDASRGDDNYIIPYVEDVVGTIDITVQALCNGDEDQARIAFQDISRLVSELQHVLPSLNIIKSTDRSTITP